MVDAEIISEGLGLGSGPIKFFWGASFQGASSSFIGRGLYLICGGIDSSHGRVTKGDFSSLGNVLFDTGHDGCWSFFGEWVGSLGGDYVM